MGSRSTFTALLPGPVGEPLKTCDTIRGEDVLPVVLDLGVDPNADVDAVDLRPLWHVEIVVLTEKRRKCIK